MHQSMTRGNNERVARYDIGNIIRNLAHSSQFKKFLTVIKILIGLALLILSVKGIQWGSLIKGISSADLAWLVLAISSVLLGLFLKVWRWAIFVRNYHVNASIARLFRAYFVGQAANIVLPLRGGELVRMGYFADEPKVLPEIASTIVLEKYLDLVALTISGILVSLKFSLDNVLNLRGLLLPLSIILTLLLIITILFGPETWRKIRTGKRIPPRVKDWLDKWVETSQWLKNPKQVLPGVWLTLLIWIVMWVTNWFLFQSLGLALGGTAAGLVLTLVYVGLFPALMPGNIGPFYFFTRLALTPFGLIQDQAIVFAVLLHAIVTLPPLLAGAIGLLVPGTHAATV
jgi:uncharacterized protein (TIRG00374 family)